MWKVVTAAVFLIVTAFLPITLLGLMMPVNDYRAMGIDGGIDCDGPLGVMLVIGPCLAVYAAGLAYSAVLLNRSKRRVWAHVLMALCAVMLLVAGVKGLAAYAEKLRPQHRQTCGDDW